ncbi:MAG: hypothetical protein ACREEE_15990, partial [Dongiaceae bacterium]
LWVNRRAVHRSNHSRSPTLLDVNAFPANLAFVPVSSAASTPTQQELSSLAAGTGVLVDRNEPRGFRRAVGTEKKKWNADERR